MKNFKKGDPFDHTPLDSIYTIFDMQVNKKTGDTRWSKQSNFSLNSQRFYILSKWKLGVSTRCCFRLKLFLIIFSWKARKWNTFILYSDFCHTKRVSFLRPDGLHQTLCYLKALLCSIWIPKRCYKNDSSNDSFFCFDYKRNVMMETSLFFGSTYWSFVTGFWYIKKHFIENCHRLFFK